MAVLGLHFCARAFSSCGKRGPLFIAMRGPLTIAASLVAEHRLQMRRLSNCGSRAQLLRGMWYLPRPGLEPMSPALAGRFSTTAPPGKPQGDILPSKSWLLMMWIFQQLVQIQVLFLEIDSMGIMCQSGNTLLWSNNSYYIWVVGTLHSSHLILTITLWGTQYYYYYFTDFAGIN